jgi:8-oxo-dGTP pyrophosphatase MutT (NUDIX family)
MAHAFGPAFLARARGHLAAFERRAVALDGRRAAAVAVVLLPDDGGRACFLLTKRATTMRSHTGQWALPGGRVDPGEGVPDAARRELVEEVGLALGEDAVLGLLDDYPTRSGYVMTPVVLWAPAAAALRPNPAEVARVHLIPLEDLDRPDAPRLVSIPESDRPVIQMPILEALVHAPTAAVIYQTREVVVHGRPTRVAHFEQPVWAWR